MKDCSEKYFNYRINNWKGKIISFHHEENPVSNFFDNFDKVFLEKSFSGQRINFTLIFDKNSTRLDELALSKNKEIIFNATIKKFDTFNNQLVMKLNDLKISHAKK